MCVFAGLRTKAHWNRQGAEHGFGLHLSALAVHIDGNHACVSGAEKANLDTPALLFIVCL